MRPAAMSVALILAGHGSHISPNTAGVVWGYVDTLRRRGIADEITAAFWKETPHYHQVLDTVTADTVVIVPVFTAAGYFSQQVIPAEMGLHANDMVGARSASPLQPIRLEQANRTIYYTRTLGEHPAVYDVVQQRIREAISSARLDSARTAVAIIGHGTNRSATTRATTRQQVAAIRSMGLTGDVLDAYLDDEPDIPSIYARTSAAHIIAVPFFLAPGSHTTRDVPQALGIKYGEYPALIDHRRVYYTPPISMDDVICDLIIQLARDTGLPFAEQPTSDEWAGFPQAGADELIAAVQAVGELQLGELLLTPDYVMPVDSTLRVLLHNPSELRRHLRENPFRPLFTTVDMKRDWLVPLACIQQLPAVVETVYPGVLADWAAQRRGTFHYETLGDVAKRQQGIFRQIDRMDRGQIADTVAAVCGQCVRHPTWHTGQTPLGAVPCPAPCNVWMSKATNHEIPV